MFDPVQHQLEIRLMAIRRWQDELGRTDDDPDPVQRAARRQEALRMIDKCWDEMMEVLGDG